MDIKKETYLSASKYIGKVTVTPSTYELTLLTKYTEPTIDVGGSFTDGTTSFTLTSDNRYMYTNNPFSQIFDPVSLGVTLYECGLRAVVFVNEITTRIQTELTTLRSSDSTNSELLKTVSI